jgi:hypothetical protein
MVSITPNLRDQMVFSDSTKIRMPDDPGDLGVRLVDTYNQYAKRDEYPSSEITVGRVSTGPTGRNGYASCYDSNRGVMVIFGGFVGATNYDETWEFDGSTWTQVVTAAQPGTGGLCRMVFDSARNVCVAYEWYDNGVPGFVSNTWEYNGTNWTQIAPATSPTVSEFCSLVFDSTRNLTVLFGGRNGAGTPHNETWEYNGTTWTQAAPTASPTARYFSGVAFDSERDVAILHGGTTGPTAQAIDETWEYDGTTWTRITTTDSPPARAGHNAVHSTKQGAMMIHGGFTYDITGTIRTDYSDSWSYNGINWTKLFTDIQFTLGQAFSAYHGGIDAMVLFGLTPTGYQIDGVVTDTMAVYDPPNFDTTVSLPSWSPDAIKAWITLQEIGTSRSDIVSDRQWQTVATTDARRIQSTHLVTGIGWRVSDGTNDYWFNGTAWVLPTGEAHWNSDVEVAENINTFPVTSKQIQLIAKLWTMDRWYTPLLEGYRLMIWAEFDWFEDLTIRSLVPRMRQDFQFVMNFAALSSGGDTFNILTDDQYIPEQLTNIVDVDAVYNHGTDPDHQTNILLSYNTGTGDVVLTAPVALDTQLFLRYVIEPEVAINFTNVDYNEIGKLPSIIVDSIDIVGRQVYAVQEISDLADQTGWKGSYPYWVEEARFNCVLITGSIVNAMRLYTEAASFVVRGATQIPGHKIGGILTTKALDLEHTLKFLPGSRYNPKANISDVKQASFTIILRDFYAWLRDVEEKPIVLNFNTSITESSRR